MWRAVGLARVPLRLGANVMRGPAVRGRAFGTVETVKVTFLDADGDQETVDARK